MRRMVVFLFFSAILLLLACIPENRLKDDFRDFHMENRLVLIFLQPGTEPDAARRMEERLLPYSPEKEERDVRYFVMSPDNGVRSNAENADRYDYDAIRRDYNPTGNRFTVILIGKDGGIKYRRDDRLDMPEIIGFIDGMPMRQRELRLREGRPDL